jgi:amidohydrolase
LTGAPFGATVDGEAQVDELIRLGRRLWECAEPGFLEHETHRVLLGLFEDLGFAIEEFTGMPGFAASRDGSPSGKRIALIADMDGLPGGEGGRYGHFCGHHMQLTALYGAALTLARAGSRVLEQLCFVAVPAEEFVDLDRRRELAAAGVIQALSGKQELLRRGFLTSFDAVVATHAASLNEPRAVSSVLAMNGFDVLRFRFLGASAHAGAQPHEGRNAQNAAALFLQACAFLREQFREDRHIRIHPVLRLRPDQAMNFIPDWASVETYARAVDPDTIGETVSRLQAAAGGCATALGVGVESERLPGYAPYCADPDLHRLARETAGELGSPFVEEEFSAASSDMGDVSQLKPTVILGLPGSNGRFHSPEFAVEDEKAAYRFPAEFLCRYLERVLSWCVPGFPL